MSSVASCACGELRIRVNGLPAVVSSCCCQACQRRSGSLAATQAFYDTEQVEAISGISQTFVRTAESSKKVTYYFCAGCGTTLYWLADLRPDKVAVGVGAFAYREYPSPDRLVWTDFRHPWVQVPEGTRQYPGNAP